MGKVIKKKYDRYTPVEMSCESGVWFVCYPIGEPEMQKSACLCLHVRGFRRLSRISQTFCVTSCRALLRNKMRLPEF